VSVFNVLPPGQDSIKEIVGRLPANQKDFSRDLIVFPGKRPGHWLRKALAERVGASFIPPNIYSIDALIEFLHNTTLAVNKPKLSSFDAVAVLFDIHRTLAQRLGRDAYNTLELFFPVGTKLVGELEEVMLADLSERRIREVLGGVQFQKFHSFAAYYEAFYREVDMRGFVTRATMYRTVAERVKEVDWVAYRHIILAGFHTLTTTEKKIVAHLRDLENVTLLFQHGIGLQKELQTLGLHVEEEPVMPEMPELRFIKAPDIHGQVFALAAQLQEQRARETTVDQRTAVVLPSSEALLPTLHFALSLLPEESYNIALQYPLTRTPVYGFLNSLMDFVASAHNGRYSSAAYLKFILHPYTKNIRFGKQAEVTRMFFHAIEEHFVRHYAKALFSLDELENDHALFESVERRLAGAGEQVTKEELRAHLAGIHDNTVRTLTSFRTVQELATHAMEVLEYITTRSTANLHPYFRPYVQRILELLDGLRTSLLAPQPLGDPLAAFVFLRACIGAESVPFPGTPLRGLQVLGLLETRNLKFDTLYLLDATDDILPGKPAQDMLLPQQIRTKLGLETSHDAERLTEYYFDLAVRSAKRVVLFYSESGDREKSRFVQKLLWQQQQRKKKLTIEEFEESVKYRVRLANERPEPIPKTKTVTDALQRGMQFSAHALDTYLACPLRFYYQNVLQLAEREEITDEMEATDVGELVHGILKKYFEPLRGKRLTENDLDRLRLERVVDECFEETFGKETTGTVLLLRRQVKHQLWEFLSKHQLPLAQSTELTVIGTEQRLEVDYKGYRFTGRIDRIERRGEQTYIVDYKTGVDVKAVGIRLEKLDSGDPGTWRAAIPSFQLPMYMLLYSQATKEPLSSLEPVYLFLGKNRIDAEIEHSIEEGISSTDVFAAVEPLMMKTIEAILDPNIPFMPTPELEKECPRCPFNTICGTQWVQGWSGT